MKSPVTNGGGRWRSAIGSLVVGCALALGALAGCGLEPDPGEDEQQTSDLLGGAQLPCKGGLCPGRDPWLPAPPKPTECKQIQFCAGGGSIACEASRTQRNECRSSETRRKVGRHETKMIRVLCVSLDESGRQVYIDEAVCPAP